MAKKPTAGGSSSQLNMLLSIKGGASRSPVHFPENSPSDSELRERIFEQLKMSGLIRSSMPK